MIIRKLNGSEEPPMNLLLLADHSKTLIEEYVERGECFVDWKLKYRTNSSLSKM